MQQIKLIDATLSMLDEFTLEKENIIDFLKEMMKAGIQQFEISEKVYHILGGELPLENTYYMKLPASIFQVDYKNIQKFIVSKETSDKNSICLCQLNDIREVVQLRNYCESAWVMIRGMDDIMLHGFERVFREIKSVFSKSKIIIAVENTYACATALTVSYLQQYGGMAVTSFYGCGNLAPTEQVCLALRTTSRYKVSQDFSPFKKCKVLYEQMTKRRISSVAPVLGERIFWVESGVHVDGILKNPSNYEAYMPELIGLKRNIVIGKHSGKSALIKKAKELGNMDLNSQEAEQLLYKVKQESMKQGRGLTDEEVLSFLIENKE